MTDIVNKTADEDLDSINFALLAEGLASEYGIDMTKAQTGGGERPLPAAGPCRLRFVGYVETGKHEKMVMGKNKVQEAAILLFEVSGPKHPPIVNQDGSTRPHIMYVDMPFSRNEKANIMKLFTRMNYAGKAKHIVGLLGEAFKGVIYHRTYKRADGSEGKAAELKSKETGYTIEAPRTEDPETGDIITLQVMKAVTPIKCFVWEKPSMAQWKSIFVDGEWEERKGDDGKVLKAAASKNIYQAAIKKALNFEGSPTQQLLAAGGVKLDLPAAESGKAADTAGADDADPLSGIGT